MTRALIVLKRAPSDGRCAPLAASITDSCQRRGGEDNYGRRRRQLPAGYTRACSNLSAIGFRVCIVTPESVIIIWLKTNDFIEPRHIDPFDELMKGGSRRKGIMCCAALVKFESVTFVTIRKFPKKRLCFDFNLIAYILFI